MKNYLKVLAMLLAVLLSVSVFASCGTTEQNEETTAAGTGVEVQEGTEAGSATESATEEVVAEATPPRPATDYAEEFFLLVHNDSNRIEYHWVEESSNDVLSQAIFDRQQKVRTHLGVEVLGTMALTTFNYIEPFKTAVKNKDGSIDMLLTHVYHGIDGFVTGNYLSNFDDIPGINLDADYWNYNIMEEASFNGKHFLAKNDFNILYTHCITFNKDIMDKYSDAIDYDVYTLVQDYQWTLDRMIALASLVYVDATADGKTVDDTFGIAGSCNIEVVGFMHSSDVAIISENEKGEYALSVFNDVNKIKTTTLVEKLMNLVDSDCAWIWKYGSGETLAFESGRTLMMLASTNNLPKYLNFDLNFGVLPYPMFDEAQKNVGYRSLQWGGYTCVPSYVRNMDMVGDTLEMLAFYSDAVNEAFYEKLIGKQVADSPIDKKMLEIVWDGIGTDFVQTFYSIYMDTQIFHLIPYVTFPDATDNLASFIARTEKSVNTQIRKFFVLIEKMEKK